MSKSATERAAISPPAGGGKVSGLGEAFSLDLNSGQSTYAIPFDIPDGVAGYKPNLKLEYAHSNANGAWGYGWQLPMRQIERRFDLGIPDDGNAREVFLDSGIEIRAGTDGKFYPLRESAFSVRERSGDGWLVSERDGSKHFFGLTPATRIAPPDSPTRPHTWLLEREEDVNGNAISYEYLPASIPDGYPYLAAIRYAKFVVRLAWEARPDVLLDGRAGYLRKMTLRCSEISVHLAATDFKFRSLKLTYETAALSGHSLLATAQLRAHEQGRPDVVKNPMTFEYARFDPNSLRIRWQTSRRNDPPPPPLVDPDTALITLDDLPLPGVLQQRNGRQYYWPNDGEGGWAAPRTLPAAPFATSISGDAVQFFDLSANGSADMLVGFGQRQIKGFYENGGKRGFENFTAYPKQAVNFPPFETGQVRLAELNGDGFVDALYASERGLVAFHSHGKNGWAAPVATLEAPPDLNFSDPTVFLADMTGDGQPDLVRVRSGQVEYFLNLGRGHFGARQIMQGSPRLDGLSRNSGQILLLDASGDGCSDLVRIGPDGITLWVNRSGQGFAPPVHFPAVPTPLVGTLRPADMSGRGAAGVVFNSSRSGQMGYVTAEWLPEQAPNLLQKINTGNGLIAEIKYAPLVEMALADRREGRIWDTFMPFPLWVVSETSETDNLRGRTTTTRYRYHNGHFDPVFRRFSGFRNVDKREVGDESRADVLTKYTFLMNQAAAPGRTPLHVHLDRSLARVEVFSLDGTADEPLAWHVEETEYGLAELPELADGTRRALVTVTATRKRYRERTADERVEETAYEYDAFGNVTAENARGFGQENGQPMPEKFLRTEVQYATDAAKRMFKVARIVKRTQAGKIVRETRRLYDGTSANPMALGILQKGLQTREEYLVLPLADFNAHYAGMDEAALGYFQQNDADGHAAIFAADKLKGYAPNGNLTEEKTTNGPISLHAFDADGVFKIRETVNGRATNIVPHPIHGKPVQITAPAGEKTVQEYDAFGRLLVVKIADDTAADPTRRITYDDVSVPNSRTTSYRIRVGKRAETVVFYDGAGKEMQQRARRQTGEFMVSAWEQHNAFGQVKIELEARVEPSAAFSKPDLTAAGIAVRRIFYDGEGRPVRSVNFNGGVNTLKISPFEIVTSDANDNDPANPNANTPRIERSDVWNFRTAVVEARDATHKITTEYQTALTGEMLVQKTEGIVQATHVYDLRGSRLSVQNAEAGLRRNFYNARAQVVRTVDAMGHDVSVTRDADDRLRTVQLAGATVEQFDYDDATNGASGRLSDARYENNGRQQFFFDMRGRITRNVLTVNGVTREFRHEFDDMGKETALIYPDGTRLERTFYDNGMLKSVAGFIAEIKYNARNLPERIAFANGAVTTYAYSPGNGRLRSQKTVGKNGVVLEDTQFGYDLMQMLASVDDAAPGATAQTAFDYDGLFQLKKSSGKDGDGIWSHIYDYAPGASGYNLAKNGESEWEMLFADAARPDRLTTVRRAGKPDFALNYDANGNVLGLPDKAFQHNFKNQLEQVTLPGGRVVRYEYDFRGNLTRRTETGQGAANEVVYLGKLVEIRNEQTVRFVNMNGVRVAIVLGGGAQTRWIHSDQTGNTKFFTDENAATRIAEIAWHPFGRERSRKGVPPTKIFALHDFDPTTGLVNMKDRWYAPELGRFLTPDPLYLYQAEKSEGSPCPLHLYTYVGNSPTNRIDPSGLSFWSVVGAVVGVVVGVIAAFVLVAAFASGFGFGLLAIAGLIALITVSYAVAANNVGNGYGEFFRGFMIGVNAGLNATLLSMLGPIGMFFGFFVGFNIFLSSFDMIASNETQQSILGWSNWLMPMSWFVLVLGIVFFVLNLLGHFFLWTIPSIWGGGVDFFRIDDFKMDWSTGSLATKGGWVSNLNNIDTAYNMGSFTFADTNNTDPDWNRQHESGHNLNLASFGSIFHIIGFVDEMIMGSGSSAYSEQLANSNDPALSSTVPMWS